MHEIHISVRNMFSFLVRLAAEKWMAREAVERNADALLPFARKLMFPSLAQIDTHEKDTNSNKLIESTPQPDSMRKE